MQRLIWLTDIHLDFVDPADFARLCQSLVDQHPDAILLGGDISTAPRLCDDLTELSQRLKGPVYFVLGNHDHYHGAISSVRQAVQRLVDNQPNLHWLSAADIVPLGKESCLLGHGGWGDGRLGDYAGSTVELNDYYLINELAGLDKATRLTRLQELGAEAAAHLDRLLPQALERFVHVLVLTHVPPYREACWHRGALSDDNYLPHFSCGATGEALSRWAARFPQRRLTVLCGHTHSPGSAQIAPNLLVRTGGAQYGSPAPVATIQVD